MSDDKKEEWRRRREAEGWKGNSPKRECPVPKPGGLIGQALGIRKEQQGRDVEVVVRKQNSLSRVTSSKDER